MRTGDIDSEVTGVLLAGGRSSRMGGRDKALLDIGGGPMLLHVLSRLRPQVDRIVINANGDPARFSGHCLPVVADSYRGLCRAAGRTARRHRVGTTRDAGGQIHRQRPCRQPVPAARSGRPPQGGAARQGSPVRHRGFEGRAAPGGGTMALRTCRGARRVARAECTRAASLRGCARMRGRRLRSRGDRRGGTSTRSSTSTRRPISKRRARLFATESRAWLKPPAAHRHRRLEEFRQDDAGRAHHSRRSCGEASRSRRSSIRTMTCAQRWRDRRRAARARRRLSRRSSSRPTPGRFRREPTGRRAAGARATSPVTWPRQTSSLVEGFKSAPIPKIEVRRQASPTQEPPRGARSHVIAVAADHATDANGLPLFDLDDAEGIADFIAALAK